MISKQQLVDEFRERVLGHIAVDEKDVHSLLNFSRKKIYARKTFLLRVGDRWNKVFYIHQGLIRLFYIDPEGREFNKAFFWEGHCIWPVAPRDRNEDSLFSITALEETVILECSFQLLYEWLRRREVWEKFALPFAETLVEQKFLREHDFLLYSAAERFQKFAETYPNIVVRIPDYHLASFLGMTNVSLSRIKRLVNL